MALVTHKSFEDTVQVYDTPDGPVRDVLPSWYGPEGPCDIPDECFFCNEKLTVPFVHWAGVTDLFVHVRCAAHLGGALLRDHIEHKSGRREANGWWNENKKRFVGRPYYDPRRS